MKKAWALLISLLLLEGTSFAIEGDSLWSQIYGFPYWDEANTMIPSGDGGFLLAGYTQGNNFNNMDWWLVKVNVQGDSLWSHMYRSAQDYWGQIQSIAATEDGGFFLFGGKFYNGGSYITGEDWWVVKVNSDGDTLWSRTFGSESHDYGRSIIPCGDGGFLLLGSREDNLWLLKINALGDSLWSFTYPGPNAIGNDIIPSEDGGFLLAGYEASASPPKVLLVKVDSNGDSLWCHVYGGGYVDIAYSIAATDDGGALLFGDTCPFEDGWPDWLLIKVDANGDSLWARTYGGIFPDAAHAIIPSSNGKFLLAGTTGSFGERAGDLWLMEVDAAGNAVWSQTYGGNLWDCANDVIPSGDGNYLAAGFTWSLGAGDKDMWLLCAEGSSTAVDPELAKTNPSAFILYPPQPNPFNPSTAIRYQLSANSYVSLKVYDIAGRLVQMLVDGRREAGVHEATFDGSAFPSGIYFARLEAGAFSQTQKLVLLK